MLRGKKSLSSGGALAAFGGYNQRVQFITAFVASVVRSIVRSFRAERAPWYRAAAGTLRHPMTSYDTLCHLGIEQQPERAERFERDRRRLV